jgi:hypothetical protein
LDIGNGREGFGYKLINEVIPPFLVSCKPLPESCGKRRVTFVPTVVEREENVVLQSIVV